MEVLNPVSFGCGHFNIADNNKFQLAIKLLKESLFDNGATMFAADNLITWNKNLSFLRNDFFLETLANENVSIVEKTIIWRSYILLYFAELASKIEGDFLELGCHTGFTAAQVIKKIAFKALGKNYYLYDLFEWKDGDEHTQLAGHKNPRMYEDVIARFATYPFVQVIKGSVPQSFAEAFPEKIAFAHIDMNHPVPEAEALNIILPKLQQGGVIIFDDYGWWCYGAQKIALDPIIAKNGLNILELPTGQALLIKT